MQWVWVCMYTLLLNVSRQANLTLLVLGPSQNLTWPTPWQFSKLSLTLNIEAIFTCVSLTCWLQAQNHCSCSFERFEGKAYSLCTQSVKVNQPAEEGWMPYVKLPPHRSLAWSWCRTYMKPLREPDGLAGPETIPQCWWWICRSGWEGTREHTRRVPPAVVNAVWQLSPWGDCQSKTLFGVQGLPPTHPLHSALTRFTAGIIIHQAAQSHQTGSSWVFHSLLNSQWLFLSQLLVLLCASGVCTGYLYLWAPWVNHICHLRVQKNNPTINTVFSVFVSRGRAGLTLLGASHI